MSGIEHLFLCLLIMSGTEHLFMSGLHFLLRKWQPTPVSLRGKSHGQRSPVGYSPWGHKESDTTELFTFTFNNEWY